MILDPEPGPENPDDVPTDPVPAEALR